MKVDIDTLAMRSRDDLLQRNAIFQAFFTTHAPRLAEACQIMSQRFLTGGRLLAFGRGAAATDAQHVSVEFVHPVIVGKRALPAIDLGSEFEAYLPVIVRPEDMVMGFAPPQPENRIQAPANWIQAPANRIRAGDEAVERTLEAGRKAGALTFGLTADAAEYSFPPLEDPFICQEVFEVLYHLLWETVHVYFEHREQGHDVGASSFLYPFLGKQEQELGNVVLDVQRSMLQKATEVNAIREAVAERGSEAISQTAEAIHERLLRGGKLITFGNGGSATDANDFAIDCVAPPANLSPVPAISLSAEPANITAVANDIGVDAIFTRQLIAHARPNDVAIGISTSGSSPNILAALAEARQRGLLTVAMAGYDGGRVTSDHLADHVLVVASDYIPRIQEVQASVYHVLRHRIAELQKEADSGA